MAVAAVDLLPVVTTTPDRRTRSAVAPTITIRRHPVEEVAAVVAV